MIRLKFNKLFLFLAVSFILLLLSFQFNAFDAATKNFYEDHQRNSESLVLGRVIETDIHGYLASGGFLGGYAHEQRVNHQYDLYKNNGKPETNFNTYQQSFGLQGFFYATTDKVFRSIGIKSGEIRLFINKLITSSFLALLLVFFLFFATKEFGFISATVCLLLLTLSQWLVVFSNNLYWMFFLIILPFVIVNHLLFSKKDYERNFRRIYLLIFISVFLGCLAGYEYISTVLISILTPFIYFSIKENWRFTCFLKRFFSAGTCGVLGFFSAIFIHALLLSKSIGDIGSGFSHIWATAAKRTHGDPSVFPEAFRKSLEANFLEVLLKYWKGTAFDLNSILGFGGGITFGSLIISLAIITVAVFFLIKFLHPIQSYEKINFSISVTLWFSILAPLSWHILAKGHSYIHENMNHVLWYVPFLLFGYCYIGLFLNICASAFCTLTPRIRLYYSSALVASIFIVGAPYLYKKETARQVWLEGTSFVSNLHENKVVLNADEASLVYIYQNCSDLNAAKFFLHIIPTDIKYLSDTHQKLNFKNLDFSWEQKELFRIRKNRFPFSVDKCVAKVDLKKYPLIGIRTGQFDGNGRLWESYIDLAGKRFVSEFQPLNFSDKNWDKGVNRSRAGFFVENTFKNRQSLKIGDTLIFEDRSVRTITSITYSNNHINIFLEGERIDPNVNGYPKIVGTYLAAVP